MGLNKTTIITASGRTFDYSDIRNNEIDIFDIAIGLSNICRFSGQLPEFYSVAAHSCEVAMLAPNEYKLHALLHDASEAYTSDIPKPLKNLFPEFKERVEDPLMDFIYESFGLSKGIPDVVKEIDNRMLATEQVQIQRVVCRDDLIYEPYDIILNLSLTKGRMLNNFLYYFSIFNKTK